MIKGHGDYQYEKDRLARTVALARERLSQARRVSENHLEEIAKDREFARENTSSWSAGSFATGDFEDIIEASQYINPIIQRYAMYELSENRIAMMERLVDSPYFARIDFRFAREGEGVRADIGDIDIEKADIEKADIDEAEIGEADIEEVYIGYASLMEENSLTMAVYDWRSPIAGVFYGFTTGPAYYDAPAGRVWGEVTLKRQYEIHGGELEFFFDADVQIIDEFLKRLLSQNAAPVMKSIVETIQAEQNAIIRDMDNDVMMVQGVAGSGKTSVALHRAAYLMYEGMSSKLSANQIMIISPNIMFERYISGVLPGLGEKNTKSAVLDELFATILRPARVQTRERFLESLFSDSLGATGIRKRLSIKTSAAMIGILDRFIEDIPDKWIGFRDISFGSYLIASKEELRSRLRAASGRAPLAQRLAALGNDLLETARIIQGRRPDREAFARVRVDIDRLTRLDLDAVIEKLFDDEDFIRCLADEAAAGAGALAGARTRVIPYDDAAIYAYLRIRLFGAKGFEDINHVLIDEAQDYNPLHFAIFNLLFSTARYTILGDINQTLEKQEDMSLYDQISGILGREKTAVAIMNKSFRCTNEILRFSAGFLSADTDIQSFNRQGAQPEVFTAPDRAALRLLIAKEVKTCVDAGYQSIGLLCKSAKNATALYKDLGGVADTGQAREDAAVLTLITSGKSADPRGAFIMPVYLSKGIEFDAVLICDADDRNYNDEDDKKLLYIACTRALHRLNVFCAGKASRLFEKEG